MILSGKRRIRRVHRRNPDLEETLYLLRLTGLMLLVALLGIILVTLCSTPARAGTYTFTVSWPASPLSWPPAGTLYHGTLGMFVSDCYVLRGQCVLTYSLNYPPAAVAPVLLFRRDGSTVVERINVPLYIDVAQPKPPEALPPIRRRIVGRHRW